MAEYEVSFLEALEKFNLRTSYVELTLLTFDEKPIRTIQGNVTSGSLNVNASSAVRRTITLSMIADEKVSDLQDIENAISINKKIKVDVKMENPIKGSPYGEILTFPCGVFVLSSASVSHSISGWSISISGKDKMCLLDGTVGGTFPASISLHEKQIQEPNGDTTTYDTLISEIIYEIVTQYGGENGSNIIITDLEDTCRMLVKYMGSSPIYFDPDFNSVSFTIKPGYNKCTYGEDAGYMLTDFTFPGEFILKAGDTVVTALNKIVQTLGNYEFFYDVHGRFVFQQIKNYLNQGSPLYQLGAEDYFKTYSNAKYLYSLTDMDTTTQINVNPKYDNIKNDFYVWGNRKVGNVDHPIRYHLAIDTKPDLNRALMYMWAVLAPDGSVIRYEYNDMVSGFIDGVYETKLCGKPCDEWREELYRLALEAQVTNSIHDAYYDAEMISEWPKLYSTMNENWDTTNHWNPDVINNPENLDFWIDFIDTGSELGKYSIKQIGRRTKVVNNTGLKTIYNKEVKDIIFIRNEEDRKKLLTYQDNYFILTEELFNLFQISSTGASCYDEIREMMYQNLCYNTSISIGCLPKYYIEPNNIIRIEDKDNNINGNYLITQFSLPLSYNGVMSITATEVLSRV